MLEAARRARANGVDSRMREVSIRSPILPLPTTHLQSGSMPSASYRQNTRRSDVHGRVSLLPADAVATLAPDC